VYLIAVLARDNGQEIIPVHIFPSKLDVGKMKYLENKYKSNLIDYWKNLKPVYDYFEKYKVLPQIFIDDSGKYRIKNNS
jgi:murein L,D-transpeptidase YafK